MKVLKKFEVKSFGWDGEDEEDVEFDGLATALIIETKVSDTTVQVSLINTYNHNMRNIFSRKITEEEKEQDAYYVASQVTNRIKDKLITLSKKVDKEVKNIIKEEGLKG